MVLVVEVDGDPRSSSGEAGVLPLAEDRSGTDDGGASVTAGKHVLVDGHGDHRGRVANVLADKLQGHAGSQQGRDVGVSGSWRRT